MSVLIVTGTGTDVGKTVVTAALAAAGVTAGRSVAVLKPAQTGVADDAETDVRVVTRLAGDTVTTGVLGRYPEPLAPNTAARRAGLPAVRPRAAAEEARRLARDHDLVLVEGAGGVLTRFDDEGGTLLDVASALGAPALVVTAPGLGTLNTTELTVREIRRRGVGCAGLVIGAWPAQPDLAMRCNLTDLVAVSGADLLGALPAGAGGLGRDRFASVALASLAPAIGGTWNAEEFTARHG